MSMFGINTELSCIGPCRNSPIINVCTFCNYVFIDCHQSIIKKKLLQGLVNSLWYSDLYNRHYKSQPFYLLFGLYKILGLSAGLQNEMLRYNYYGSNKIKDLELLCEQYEILLQSYDKLDGLYFFMQLMIGEYNRRTRQFEKAKDIFMKLKQTTKSDMDERELQLIHKRCDFQLKLLKQKNDKLEIYKF